MDYVSPGDAFSSSLEHSLLLRADQQRQAQQDQLAAQRQAQVDRNQEEERQQAREALAEKRQEFADKQKETRKGSFEKSLGTMVPGDTPSPDLIAQAKEFGMGHLFPEIPAEAPPPPSPAPLPIPMPATAPEGGIPLPTAEPPPPDLAAPLRPGGMRFIGTPKQRDQQELETKVNKIRDRLATAVSGSPEERAAILDYELTTNKAVPAAFLRTQGGGDSEPVARQNPKSGVVERLVDGVWTPVTGNVPKGTHFMTVPDHSASDAAGSARDAEGLRKAYESAVTELNTRSKPIEGHISAINDLGMALNERTPQADALIAPLVLKATVSGTGTGFRMTQSEINQVMGARSKWETLSAALNKWSADPTQALSITDEQRVELRALAKAIRTKAQKQMDTIIKTRHGYDDATNPNDIKRGRTQLQEDLSKGEDADSTVSGPSTPPKRIRYDINGKQVQ